MLTEQDAVLVEYEQNLCLHGYHACLQTEAAVGKTLVCVAESGNVHDIKFAVAVGTAIGHLPRKLYARIGQFILNYMYIVCGL